MKSLWNKFKSLFRKKSEERTYNDHLDDIIRSTQETNIRLAIIVGHTNSARGANTYTIPLYGRKISEYEWNSKRAEEIKFHLHQLSSNAAAKIIKRDGIGIKGAYKAAGKWGATHIIELHLNSMGENDFYGAEILTYKGDTHSVKVATDFLKKFCAQFDFQNRGVKVRVKKDRGGTSLYCAKKYTKAKVMMLLEPTFVGTRTTESARLLEGSGPDDYSRFIAKFIADL